jgi:tungstate transport system ATP-binding protein
VIKKEMIKKEFKSKTEHFVIHINNISKNFANRQVLKNVSMSVKKGEIIGIIGRSGAGKTTLLRIINMLEHFDDGSYHIFGECVKKVKKNSFKKVLYQRKMAMLFQKPMLFNETVLENVIYGLKIRGNHSIDSVNKIKTYLERFNILEHDKNALFLSGGETQRVALLQTCVLEPELLLLDEPTANLDENNIRILEKHIFDLNKKKATTVIISSHDTIHLKSICHRVYKMEKGELIIDKN